jgi:hypothetical protein
LAPIGFFSLVFIMILAAVSLVLRYRSSGQLVRLQLRWFILGGFLYIILTLYPTFFIGDTITGTGVNLLIFILSFSAILLLCLAVGIAILRYRLYDIDVIIRRTLVYTILTAALGLVYFGTVVLLQTVVGRSAAEQSPLVIVFSTLLIAALFNPLRHRIQAFIDRRFFRQKYDAAQTLTNFAQTARDEVELNKLSAVLINAVEETLQPEQISLWIKSK